MILMELLLAAPGPSGVLVRGRALPVRGVQLYSVLTTFLCGAGFSQITTDIGTHTTCNIETHAHIHIYTCLMHSRAQNTIDGRTGFQLNSQQPSTTWERCGRTSSRSAAPAWAATWPPRRTLSTSTPRTSTSASAATRTESRRRASRFPPATPACHSTPQHIWLWVDDARWMRGAAQSMKFNTCRPCKHAPHQSRVYVNQPKVKEYKELTCMRMHFFLLSESVVCVCVW
jgi:hypothetical protein